MAGQSSITTNPAAAIEGMRDDLHFADHAETRALTDAAGIGAGRVVQDGTTIGSTCAALTASGQPFVGVTVLDLSKEPKTPRNAQGDDVAVLKQGTIWMTCVDDMRNAKGTPFICVSGANAGLPQASAVGADIGAGLIIVQGGDAGQLGKFRVSIRDQRPTTERRTQAENDDMKAMTPEQRRTYEDSVRVLSAMGLYDPKGPGMQASGRADANETMFFARQLEYIQVEVVEDEFPALKAKQLIPLKGGIPAGAQSFTWRQWSRVGLAKMAANYATDIPDVKMFGTEATTSIRSVVSKYSYSTQDIRSAMMGNVPLDSMYAKYAREAYERKVDSVLALGDSVRNVPGFLKNSAVPIVTAGITGNWNGSTPSQILADLYAFAFSVWNNSKQIHSPATILLAGSEYQIIASTPFSSQVPDSILEVFLRSSTMVREVVPWLQCEGAAANGTDNRAVAYTRDPSYLAYIEPLPFQALPPQAHGFEFDVPCEGRVGGTVIYRPLSMAYCDIFST